MTKHLTLLLAIITALLLASCDDKNDEPLNDSIIGSWYGTRTYYNPAGGTKYQDLTITFESNGTGTLEYESPSSYSIAKFQYSVSGKNVHCYGAYANTSGDVDTDFTMNLIIEKDRLLPQDTYSQFILTRDNSVMTDGDGNEVIDLSDLLQQVWVNTSGETVIVFDYSTVDEYILSYPFSETYETSSTSSYSYDPARKIINIDGVQFDIWYLTETFLSINNPYTGQIFSYNIGSYSDIPHSAD